MFGNEPIFEVDYRVDGNALYRHTAKTIERIVPWGPDAGACLYFYRMIEPERLTIALRCKRKYWAIDQLRGVCNRMATTDCAGPIWNWVQSSWASSAAAERVNSAVILRQLAPVRRRLHSTDQLSFSFEQSE